jgi:hypothetical protein
MNRRTIRGEELCAEPFCGYVVCVRFESPLRLILKLSTSGSAMRCTEGVWLSVTCARDYIVVAMDFEGQDQIFNVIYRLISV